MNDYRLLETIFNHLPFMIAFVDTEQCYRFINHRYANHFGITDPHGIVGKHVREVLGEELYETLKPKIKDALGGALVQYEVQHPSQETGALHYFRGHIIGVYDEAESLGYVVVIEDITEWKQ